VFTRLAGTIRITGKFQNKYIQRRNLLDDVGKMTALERAVSVPMRDEDLPFGRLHRSQPFPSQAFASSSLPSLQPFTLCTFVHLLGRKHRRKINQPPLTTRAPNACQYIQPRAQK
jgi:hypothetical protein